MFLKNKETGKEVLTVGKDVYTLYGNFALIRDIEKKGYKAIELYNKFASENATIQEVSDVISCALKTKNSVELFGNSELSENLIEQEGFSKCYALSMILLSYAMIGDFNRKKYQALNNATNLINTQLVTHWKSFKKALLFLIIQGVIFGIALCIILKLIEKLFF